MTQSSKISIIVICISFLCISNSMAFDPEHLARLKNTNQCVSCDLSGAYLTGANLSNAYLEHANLTGANLNGTNLQGAKWTTGCLCIDNRCSICKKF